jgi:CheY-like chemotaxis protein
MQQEGGGHMTSPQSKGAHVLLVDDDRDLVDILRIVLEGAGYRVSGAHGPAEGIRLVEQLRPDLVLLDVMMPDGTEGFHVVWTLRARDDAYFRRLPIIMLTAVHRLTPLRFYPDASDGTYEPGEFLPVQDFVDKPVEPQVLLDKVARVLRAAAVRAT